jgi:sulfur carrier protein
MDIIINGERETLAQESLTVAELLSLKQVDRPDMVSVQLNGEFLDRQQYAATQVKNQDELDFLYFMGGGGR